MSNFEYIISSLPYLTADYKYAEGQGFGSVLDEIRANLSEKDNALVDDLLEGFDPEKLGADFYARALRHRNRFLREYFRFDLNLRNAKVRFLNRELGRDPEQDVLTGEAGEDEPAEKLDIDLRRFSGGEFEAAAKAEFVLSQEDLLTREKGLDDLTWDTIDRLITFHYFDIEAVLGYIAKLHIADRWLALDETEGRERFRRLVQEVRGTFKGVQYNG